jgi:hypothetical protein
MRLEDARGRFTAESAGKGAVVGGVEGIEEKEALEEPEIESLSTPQLPSNCVKSALAPTMS